MLNLVAARNLSSRSEVIASPKGARLLGIGGLPSITTGTVTALRFTAGILSDARAR